MEGIVKLQAVAQGRSVRCTFTGLKVAKSSVKRRLWFQKILSEEIHDGVDDDTAELGQPSSSPSETSQNNLKSKVLFISNHPWGSRGALGGSAHKQLGGGEPSEAV
ncbi:unnamed protein product [Musa acuminata subsp. burmannicoides]